MSNKIRIAYLFVYALNLTLVFSNDEYTKALEDGWKIERPSLSDDRHQVFTTPILKIITNETTFNDPADIIYANRPYCVISNH